MTLTVPTSYTDATLETYMYTVLGETADALGLSAVPADFDEAVYDTLIMYGVSTVSSATNITKLRKLAEYNAWRRALAVVSSDYDFSDAGSSYSRSQMFNQIKERVAQLKKEALPYISDYAITSSTIDWKNDPYEYHAAGTYEEVSR